MFFWQCHLWLKCLIFPMNLPKMLQDYFTQIEPRLNKCLIPPHIRELWIQSYYSVCIFGFFLYPGSDDSNQPCQTKQESYLHQEGTSRVRNIIWSDLSFSYFLISFVFNVGTQILGPVNNQFVRGWLKTNYFGQLYFLDGSVFCYSIIERY